MVFPLSAAKTAKPGVCFRGENSATIPQHSELSEQSCLMTTGLSLAHHSEEDGGEGD